ncbi:uncharacterized protein LOC120797704 [Xiphias gladius]|uniref:uncharacterized protein LOC120797704 n=1 Tax=Xiphias gladius TaxID=8245 RepID=UPI001A980B33|nr:uncharacterized protein LOC120797704 [Xiphias gladius]
MKRKGARLTAWHLYTHGRPGRYDVKEKHEYQPLMMYHSWTPSLDGTSRAALSGQVLLLTLFLSSEAGGHVTLAHSSEGLMSLLCPYYILYRGSSDSTRLGGPRGWLKTLHAPDTSQDCCGMDSSHCKFLRASQARAPRPRDQEQQLLFQSDLQNSAQESEYSLHPCSTHLKSEVNSEQRSKGALWRWKTTLPYCVLEDHATVFELLTINRLYFTFLLDIFKSTV